ncbi:Oidioi.mRNA.OKI2018_I69.XSR.g15811.t1.cds [Oikopleura dioica]|uniref:Oidioi.mRNA.OKI2018_I69.XSR.g15811.t1.cds n=1 Tax=Oikopleura dioica TaxID=34765 RepID=A0ABN7SI88_OIKDI|nr:Oidioi.mRNA.OKI2018_I69.XSR.g15811.t1.cds [Oikopleura dioica]
MIQEFQTFVKTIPGDHRGQFCSIYFAEENSKFVLTRGRAIMGGIRVEGAILEEKRDDFFGEWFANSSGSTVFTNSENGLAIPGCKLVMVNEWKINQLHKMVGKFSSEEFPDSSFRKGFALSLHDEFKDQFQAKATAF